MCASIAARCSSVMRSRMRPRISQILSPWKLAMPWPGQRPPLLHGEVLAGQRQHRLLLVVEMLAPVGRAARPRPSCAASAGPRRRRPATPPGDRLASSSSASASWCCVVHLVDQRVVAGAALAQEREDQLLLAVVVRPRGRTGCSRSSWRSAPPAPRRPARCPRPARARHRGVSRKTPCTAYMSVTSGRGAAAWLGHGLLLGSSTPHRLAGEPHHATRIAGPSGRESRRGRPR